MEPTASRPETSTRGLSKRVRDRALPGRFKKTRLETESIRAGRYFAWDVSAALAAWKRPRQRGRLVQVEGARPNATTAVSADPDLVLRMFWGL